MTKYDAVYDVLCDRVEAGLLSVDTAEYLNNIAYEMYKDDMDDTVSLYSEAVNYMNDVWNKSNNSRNMGNVNKDVNDKENEEQEKKKSRKKKIIAGAAIGAAAVGTAAIVNNRNNARKLAQQQNKELINSIAGFMGNKSKSQSANASDAIDWITKNRNVDKITATNMFTSTYRDLKNAEREQNHAKRVADLQTQVADLTVQKEIKDATSDKTRSGILHRKPKEPKDIADLQKEIRHLQKKINKK